MLHRQLRKLEDEIRACEARVQARDLRLGRRLNALRDDAIHFVGKRLMVAGAALAGLWLLRPKRAAQAHEGPEPARPGPGIAELLQRWSPLLLPLLTPLLDRKVATFLASLGLPVILKPLAPLPTVPVLDLARYAGRWYQLGRLQDPGKEPESEVSIEYTPDGEGGLSARRHARLFDGRRVGDDGRLRVPDATQPGQLELSFAPSWLRWWPGTWRDHWVLYLDDDDRYALVGTPERDGLWLFARTPSLPPEEEDAMKSLAMQMGFDGTRWLRTPQAS